MADPRDDRVSSAYREMPGHGPTPALDAAIQAAARRAVGSRPGAARRWQIPVSIAAVLALAVGISLQVDREKPMVADGTPVSSGSAQHMVPPAASEKEERPTPAMPAPKPVAPAQAPLARQAPKVLAREFQAVPQPKRFAPDPPGAQPPVAASLPAPASLLAPSTVAAPSPARAPAAPSPAAGATAPVEAARTVPQAVMRAKSVAARDAATQGQSMNEALEPPERSLERIAELRAKELHDEADRALAEFHRAYPAYRLSEEWLRKVERR